MAKKNTAPTTQKYLDISAIRDGVVILREGGLRHVLIVSSINFALKSEDEQNALVAAYVRFLNSLDFPLQITIQSRRLNIDAYIERLRSASKNEDNELLRSQIDNYISFVKELVEIGDIMSKRFFVTVPYSPGSSSRRKSYWARLKEVLAPAVSVRLKEKYFKERQGELQVRTDRVLSGLKSIGLDVVQLDTQSLIELYRNTYNPELAEVGGLASIDKLRVEEDLYFIE